MRTRFSFIPLISLAFLLSAACASESAEDTNPASGGQTGGAGGTGGGGAGGSAGTVTPTNLCFTGTSGPTRLADGSVIGATSEAAFLGTTEGLFRSLDGKTGWKKFDSTPFPGQPVKAITSHAGDIFVGLARRYDKPAETQPTAAVYRGKPDGTGFEPAADGLPPLGESTGKGLANLTQLSDGAGKLLAIIATDVYAFDDAANHWSIIPTTIELGGADAAVATSTGILANSTSLTGVFEHDGSTWNKVDQLPAWGYRFTATTDLVFAAHETALLQNVAGTWTDTHTLPSNVVDLLVHDSELFAVTAAGVSASTDGGTNWTDTPFDVPEDSDSIFGNAPASLAAIGSSMLAIGEDLHTSDDGGKTWQGTDLLAGDVTRLVSVGVVLLASVDTGFTYRSTDLGASWEKLPLPGHSKLAVQPWLERTYFSTPTDLFVSTDAGTTLTPIQRPPALSFGPIHVMATNSAVFASGFPWQGATCGNRAPGTVGNPAVMRSTDSGATWQNAMSGLPVIFTSCAGQKAYPTFRDVFELDGVMLAVTDSGSFRSTDAGVSWQAIAGVSLEHAVAIGNTFVAGTKTGIVTSLDQGVTWTESKDLVGLEIGGLHAKDGVAYASVSSAGESAGVYTSVDAGKTWKREDTQLGFAVGNLALVGDTLFAAVAGQAVWKSALSCD